MKEYIVRAKRPEQWRTGFLDLPVWKRFNEGEEAQMQERMRDFLSEHYANFTAWHPFIVEDGLCIGYFLISRGTGMFNPFCVEIARDGVLP